MGELLGFIGGITGMVIALPQVRRVRALGHGRGVSVASWVLTFLVSASWLGWALRVGSPSAIFSNLVAGVLNAAVVAALIGSERRPALLLPTIGLGAVAVAQVLPMGVLSAALIALTTSRLPQVKHSWDNRHSVHESAVSVGSLGIGVVSLLCWEAYAVLEHRYLVNVTSTIALTLIIAIAAIETSAPRVVVEAA